MPKHEIFIDIGKMFKKMDVAYLHKKLILFKQPYQCYYKYAVKRKRNAMLEF